MYTILQKKIIRKRLNNLLPKLQLKILSTATATYNTDYQLKESNKIGFNLNCVH